MAIVTGNKLLEFSTLFWNTCLSTIDWKDENLYILEKIPTDKFEKLSKYDLSYSKADEDKPIFLTDDSILLIKRGAIFSSHHFYGFMSKQFQYNHSEIESLSIQGEIDSEEFGSIYINDNFVGKFTSNSMCKMALKEYFRKLTVNDLALNVDEIQSIINPKLTNSFLMELSNFESSLGTLTFIRENQFEGEGIIEFFDPIILTNIRVISKKNNIVIIYHEITNVMVTKTLENAKKANLHAPNSWGWQASIATGVANMLINSNREDKIVYWIEFFVNYKCKLRVSTYSRDYLMNMITTLKRFNVESEIHF